MNYKSKKIIHPLLIAVFPVLFVYVNNIQEIEIQEIFMPLILILGISIVIWITLRIVLKNNVKSALLVSFFLALFFFYGHIYNLTNDLSINDMDIGRHRYLIIPFLSVIVAGSYFFIRTKRKLDNVTTITNFIAITLIAIVIVDMIIYGVENTITYDNILDVNAYENKIQVSQQLNFPDIYYIILDGYGGTSSLKETLGFDNNDFILFLKSRGFYIPKISYSNYPISPSSIAATLNMKYINYLSNETDIKNLDLHPTLNLIKDNSVMKILRAKGYKIISFESRLVSTNEMKNVDLHTCEDKSLLKNKLLNTVARTSMIGYFVEKWIHQDVRNTTLCTFSELPNVMKIEEPTFAFAHIMSPHPPYLFGPNGEYVDPIRQEGLETWENTEGYLNQLQFTNKKVKELIDKLLESEEKPIIIIQSDHGTGFSVNYKNPNENMVQQRMSNFNAYYLPTIENPFPDNITNVNSFRIIFNAYFDDNYELLDDKLYWNSYFQPYNFTDVTSIAKMN